MTLASIAWLVRPAARAGREARPAGAGRVALRVAVVVGLAAVARPGGAEPPVAEPPVAKAPAAEATRTFTIADGSLSLAAPEGWTRVQPKSRMVEVEFGIPSVGEGDAAGQPGRMTVMGAGGSVEQNIDRWYGQFAQPDGSATKDRAATKKLSIAGCRVTIVDVSGTFKDMPGGPFAGGKPVERPGYRMLAAIVETPSAGNHFLKFYGPGETVAKHADGFRAMVEGMVPAAP